MSGRLTELWKDSNYKVKDFSRRQLDLIRGGIKDGLTLEQVRVYMKPEYDDHQMFCIYQAFMSGLSPEQVAIFARPEYSGPAMQAIKLGLSEKFSQEYMDLFMRPEFDGHQMLSIARALGKCPPGMLELLKRYIRPEFDGKQMEVIFDAILSCIPEREIAYFAKPEIDFLDMFDRLQELLDERRSRSYQVSWNQMRDLYPKLRDEGDK